MKSLAVFNHKGGVGKSTLIVNLAAGFVDNGLRPLIVDADPQCNVSAFLLEEDALDQILNESSEGEATGKTLWSAVKPIVDGTGDIDNATPLPIWTGKGNLLVGDVLLSRYEEELSSAWTDSFARKPRGYSVMGALSKVASTAAAECGANVVMYDVGPSVGALNRSVLLGVDGFITPVAPDLFSLRALTSVGQAVSRWVNDWKTISELASAEIRPKLLAGRPKYLGYVTSAFKAYGRGSASIHAEWERKISPRVKSRVYNPLHAIDPELVSSASLNLGAVKNYQSLAAQAQKYGLPLGWLTGYPNAGYNAEISAARTLFSEIAKRIAKAGGIS